MTDSYNISYVRSRLLPSDQAAQLGEEATELSHAAQKLARSLIGRNPTPVTIAEAMVKVYEELADVLNAVAVMGIQADDDEIAEIRSDKLARWVKRLKEREAAE